MAALVQVVGRARLVRTLNRAAVEFGDFKESNTVLAKKAAEIVRGEAPIGTGRSGPPGRLRADIRGSKAKTKVSVLSGRARLRYAGPINWGWDTRPNPAKGWRGGPIAANNYMERGGEKAVPMVSTGWESHLQNSLNDVKGA